jgi:hypothetical protein
MTGKFIALTALLLVLHPSDYPTDLVVHEWGTFTTLASSDGTLLNGLYLDEEPLPGFVNQMRPVTAGRHDLNRPEKGLYFKPLHVKVKMETPVIYFYSPRSLPVSVRVDFPRGLISQWFPSCTASNQPGGWQTDDVKAMDFASPVHGFMEWQARVLAPGSTQKLTHEISSPVWNTPRLTDANLLAVRSGDQEQIEKFIFYRGVANFSPPITAKFIAGSSASIEIANTGNTDLPFVFAYEKTAQGDSWLYWQGGIPLGQHQLLDLKTRQKMTLAGFEKALVDAGLYPKEARAMLNTWKNSYFGRQGIRIFWIAPETWVNSILPLKITPQPKEIRRVFVGRYELLSPGFESTLVRDWRKNRGSLSPGSKAANDRYHLAYEDFLRHSQNR